jgi:hypothetical protein
VSIVQRLSSAVGRQALAWRLCSAPQTRLASSAEGRLRTIVEHYCPTAYCSTAVLSRLPTSFSLASLQELSDSPRRLGRGTIEDNRRTLLSNAYCSTAVLSRLPTSFSLASLQEPSDSPRRLGRGTIETIVEHYCSTAVLSRLPTSFSLASF